MKFSIGQLVCYVHGSGGQHWHGRVCAIETYADVHGSRTWYHVRWIDPNGFPHKETVSLPAEELDSVE